MHMHRPCAHELKWGADYFTPNKAKNFTQSQAIAPVAGIVRNQVQRMRSTSSHRSALGVFATPTPMMEVEMAWVVETGMPNCAAAKSTVAAVVSAAKP